MFGKSAFFVQALAIALAASLAAPAASFAQDPASAAFAAWAAPAVQQFAQRPQRHRNAAADCAAAAALHRGSGDALGGSDGLHAHCAGVTPRVENQPAGRDRVARPISPLVEPCPPFERAASL